MQDFMRDRGIKAGTLAVGKEGTLLLARGYGFGDVEGRRPVSADDPFRIASLAKPITAAAVRRLIRDQKLSPDTNAFAYLGVSPSAGSKPDPRLKEVTVQHLLDHTGGWDRDEAYDPMFRPLVIAAALGKAGPASSADVIQYMAGQPLQFAPGTKTRYSNFGYCVLGRVIEKASGQSYMTYLQKAILEPLQIRSVEIGRSLPKDRNPREPFYSDRGRGLNVFDPNRQEQVPAPDGTFHLEAMDAHGGLIASSVDLMRFLHAYWLNGEPRALGAKGSHVFFGSLPGTFTMALQRPDGVNIVVLFAQRDDPSGLDYFRIKQQLNEVADGIGKWPRRD